MTGGPRHRRARRVLRAMAAVVGWVVLVAAADAGLGALLNGTDPAEPAVERTSRFLGEDDDEVDAEAALAPTGGDGEDEWSEAYWAELRLTEERGSEFVPFLEWRLPDTDLTYIHEKDGVRRSYEQDGLGPEAPTVWFFGGSTMWGEGQRDDYTIPSMVARLAEEQGVAVRVQNRGQRAWVFWQEVLAFEQALAEQEPPDVVVFYDGTNDTAVQQGDEEGLRQGGRPSDQPTTYLVGGGYPVTVPPPFSAPRPPPESDSLLERWADASMLAGLAMIPAAGAAAGEARVPEAVRVERVLDIYERGRALADHFADGAGAAPLYFWQPDMSVTRGVRTTAMIRAGLTPPTIDIADALDGVDPSEVYIDGAHTNEYGAELVADAIWTHLRPVIESLPGD